MQPDRLRFQSAAMSSLRWEPLRGSLSPRRRPWRATITKSQPLKTPAPASRLGDDVGIIKKLMASNIRRRMAQERERASTPARATRPGIKVVGAMTTSVEVEKDSVRTLRSSFPFHDVPNPKKDFAEIFD